MTETRLPPTALILLAAGNATRMGALKQLLDCGGKPMIRFVAETALASGCRPVIVVLGAAETEIRPALAELNVEIVINDRWAEGMGTSIQAGLCALENREIAAAILALSDQPFVTSAFLHRLIEDHHQSGRPIVASRYADTAGVPALFARSAFPLLMALEPGQGCKSVILSHSGDSLLLECPEALQDIDTPEDYARARHNLGIA